MIRHYCTYFDHHYFPQGMAMMQSLRHFQPETRFTVLCLSPECGEMVRAAAWKNLTILTLADLETAYPEFFAARENRSRLEYYFTCTPFLVRMALAGLEAGGLMTYLDADLGFFADPAPLFDELGEGSIALIPHRFPPDLEGNIIYGTFNVGWLTFRQDRHGRACLDWWAERCAEWCYDRVEPGRFGDQKYLDEFPDRFSGVHILQHPGANLAPWNIRTHQLSESAGSLRVDGQPLIFFHFHGFKFPRRWAVAVPFHTYGAGHSRPLRKCVVEPWLKGLSRWETRKADESALGRVGLPDAALAAPGESWKDLVAQVRAGHYHVRGFRSVIVKLLKNLGVARPPARPKKSNAKSKAKAKPAKSTRPKPAPGPPPPPDQLRFTGDYGTWEEASTPACGYDAPHILTRTRDAMRKLLSGEAAFERDSVLMDVPEYPFSTLAGLLPAAAGGAGRLSVLDFGGALGSTYFACRPWLDQIPELHWSVIEQSHYVECGRAEFSSPRLAFHHNIGESLAWRTPDVILLSGSLQFMPDPVGLFQELCGINAPWILLDRTPFWDGPRHRLAVQHVPAGIYEADYPCWLFCETLLLESCAAAYEAVASWPALDVIPLEGGRSYFKGILLRRRTPAPS
jgi:putative methyltransferase (TIGR04325 family)